jgi:glycosyltransferase involved in cell wall biosynthesis
MPTTRPALSIVVPAYNEAANILGTLGNVSSALAGLGLDPEILVIDDGSRDNTADLVRSHASQFPGVRLLINERNMGFGATYRRGVDAATGAHIVMVHGDNAWGAATLRDLFSRVGQADIIIGYTRNMWRSRTVTRTVISKTFTMLVNAITGRGLQYYNGLQIHRADVLKGMTIESSGFGFQPEVLVKALQQTQTLIEVPMDLMEREHGDSKAFRWKNAVDVYRTLRRLRAITRLPQGYEGRPAGAPEPR